MDASVSAYALLMIMLCTFFVYVFSTQFAYKIYFWLLVLFYFISALILASDVEIYQNWGYRLDHTVMHYIKNPFEVGHFLSKDMVLRFLTGVLVLFVISFYCIKGSMLKWNGKPHTMLLPLILILGSSLVFMRGGFGMIPLNPGRVYFSKVPFQNHLANNPIFNIFYGLRQESKLDESYHFMESKTMDSIMSGLIVPEEKSCDGFLKNKTPNILFVILESFTGNLIDGQYQGKTVTPNLNRIFKKGIHFSQAYASGDRTDKGLIGILSAYPAQMKSSIIMYPRKVEHLPSLVKELKKAHYSSAFYYGGDLDFANMRSYLVSSGFDFHTDKKNFDPSTFNAKWGVHDHILFDYSFNEINKLDTPFFGVILTLSSHPPYDIPITPLWANPESEELMFLNSMHYADSALGVFYDRLVESSLWNDLLLVLVADHGCRFPGKLKSENPAKYHIVMHLTGGAVQWDSTITKFSAQHDLCKTILNQMDLNSDAFKLSQDLFSPVMSNQCFYSYNTGVGMVSALGSICYSIDELRKSDTIDKSHFQNQQLQAYVQWLMQDFNSR